MSNGRGEGCTDPSDGVCGGLVLPDAQDRPAGRGQCALVFEIASTGGLQLAGPPHGVGSREGGVLGAPVPEAPVDEHGDTCAREDDVGLASESGDRSAMLEEAETRAVKGRP